MNFEHINLLKRMKMSIEELEEYYKQLRQYELENNETIKGIELRKKINSSFNNVLKILRFLNKQTLTVLNDKREKTEKPIIFAVSHIGRYDIEIGEEVIKDPNYIMIGDPRELYKSFDGLMLYIKGLLPFDIYDKLDRSVITSLAIKTLNQGGNIFLFPEGAWNITPNEAIMKLFPGAVKMAIAADAEIVPIAIEQYGKDYVANIGKNIVVDKNRSVKEQTEYLRDAMATLKWEIWEQKPVVKRIELGNYDELYNLFIDQIMKETSNGYDVEEIEKTRYKDKNVYSEKEVFDFLDNIEITPANSFLLRK